MGQRLKGAYFPARLPGDKPSAWAILKMGMAEMEEIHRVA